MSALVNGMPTSFNFFWIGVKIFRCIKRPGIKKNIPVFSFDREFKKRLPIGWELKKRLVMSPCIFYSSETLILFKYYTSNGKDKAKLVL